MSAGIRQVCIAFGVLIAVASIGARAPWASKARPDAFPEKVAVVSAPTPNIYADKPDVRVLQLLSSMNDMWARAFYDAGDTYEVPRIEPRRGVPKSDCGTQVSGWAGVYCPHGERIVIDISNHTVIRAGLGDERSDLLIGYVLAHEVGHHVQALRGFKIRDSQADILKSELHAECLAGVWGKAAGRPVMPIEHYAADADHGTVEQQRHWLELGHASGKPAACDAVWAG
jgi:predicted metalloprotease